VLLVEDERAVRGIAHRILERAGYTVLAAEDGPGALELVREYAGPIDLLLTDVVMPRLSGKELAERLTAERPELRVVYMTGYTDDAIVHHGVGAEGVAVVGKPFTPAALLQALAAALGAPARG
jgi:CheY-like chemotaxis protein